jgi:hypothetical protein
VVLLVLSNEEDPTSDKLVGVTVILPLVALQLNKLISVLNSVDKLVLGQCAIPQTSILSPASMS